jgi:hypothetical protein
MNFEEIEQSLPNGFHDATLLQASLDSIASSATLKLSVHISLEGDTDRERYRVGILKATGVSLFFIEPPDPNYNFVLNGKGISVSGDAVSLGQVTELNALMSKLPTDATVYRLFLEEWNSFLYIAAREAMFMWEED